MKINEATYENIKVLKELANIIVNHTQIPQDNINTIYLSQIPQFTQLYNQYINTKFKTAFQIMETTEIIFINDPNYNDKYFGKNTNYGGYWSSTDNQIVIFLYNNITNTNNLIKVLIHELRHLFQTALYGDYANSIIAHKPKYESRPIELDATWHDIIGNTIIEYYYGVPTEYADHILYDMKKIKSLSPKIEKHYYRKTLKYYATHINEIINDEFLSIIKKQSTYLNKWPPLTIQEANQEIQTLISDLINQLNQYTINTFNTNLNQKQIITYKEKAKKYLSKTLKPHKEKIKTKELIKQITPEWENIISNIIDNNITTKNFTTYHNQILSNLLKNNKILNDTNSPIIKNTLQYFYDKTNQLLWDIALEHKNS